MILATVVAILALTANPVAKCFRPESPTKEMAKATAVFSGKVVAQEKVLEKLPSDELVERVIVKISVDRVWKGNVYTEVTMYTSQIFLANGLRTIDSEDFNFKDEENYLVYAFGEPDRLRTHGCTRTTKLSSAYGDLAELGEGREPNQRN